jgi:hypothetical protein
MFIHAFMLGRVRLNYLFIELAVHAVMWAGVDKMPGLNSCPSPPLRGKTLNIILSPGHFPFQFSIQ